MSVQYFLDKPIVIGDLKKVGLVVEDHRKNMKHHPFTVSNGQDTVAISSIDENGEGNDDELTIKEFEGRFSHGGASVMLEICDKLDCKFITDEDIDELFYTDGDTITKEMYDDRTERFREYLK